MVDRDRGIAFCVGGPGDYPVWWAEVSSRPLSDRAGSEYDKGRGGWRIESVRYRYHFTGILRYVDERHYECHPDSCYDYLDVSTAELTVTGQDVNPGKQP